ncbi:MAG: ion transporter [Lachnospiraceae bacterium]|nr:ion transporter [Lachnospiraceae bacterium]
MKEKRKRIFEVIQIGNRGDAISRGFDYFIVAVIIINVAVLFMETFQVFAPYYDILRIIEGVTIAIFIVEYILRLWTADLLYPKYSRGKAILRFIFSFDGIVDLLTILPFFFLSGFVALRILRVVRIFRMFKINSTYDSFSVISTVFRKKKKQIASSVFIIFLLMLVASLCMYSAEHDAQPDVFVNAFSGIWFSISTIFTVGYGDIYPITVLGKVMTIIITLLGVGAVAVPTGIISAGFVEQYTEMAIARHNKEEQRHALIEAVGSGSPYIGMTIKEIERKYKCDILAIQRAGELIVPGSTTQIRKDDTIISHRFE